MTTFFEHNRKKIKCINVVRTISLHRSSCICLPVYTISRLFCAQKQIIASVVRLSVPSWKVSLMDPMACRKLTNTAVVKFTRIFHTTWRHWIIPQLVSEHYVITYPLSWSWARVGRFSSPSAENFEWVGYTSHVHEHSVLSKSTLYRISSFSQIYGWSDVDIRCDFELAKWIFRFDFFFLELFHVVGFNLAERTCIEHGDLYLQFASEIWMVNYIEGLRKIKNILHLFHCQVKSCVGWIVIVRFNLKLCALICRNRVGCLVWWILDDDVILMLITCRRFLVG